MLCTALKCASSISPASLSSRTQPKLSDSVSSDEDFFSEASEEEEEVEEAAVDHYESLVSWLLYCSCEIVVL